MTSDLITDLSNFEILEPIGDGSFGTVFLVQSIETRKLYAAKVSKFSYESTNERRYLFKEISMISRARHPAILPLIGFNPENFQRQNNPTFITEFIPNGSLSKLMSENPQIPLPKKYIIILGIAQGMNYLHSQKILHLDLKPNNILLDQNLYPRICDFGESRLTNLTNVDISNSSYTATPFYTAPEIFSERTFSSKSDVFSFGIIFYEILSGKSPYNRYKSVNKLKNEIKKGKRPDLAFITDKHIQNFLKKCWSPYPNKRPTFKEVIEEVKLERYRQLMRITDQEVDKYLSLFGERLNMINERDLIKEKVKYGDIDSICRYARMHYKGEKVPIDKKKAAEYYKIAADKGSPSAMYNYAYMLQHGDGIPVNKSESIRYYKMAIEHGNSSAMNSYALMLKKGEGVKPNKSEAIRYYKMSMNTGNSVAMNSCAIMLQHGEGIPVNKNEAVRHYKMGIEHGNVSSMNNYARMLHHGEGVDVNKSEAIRLYKMAIEKGNAAAMNSYGYLLQHGDGVQLDKREAIRYYKMAIEKGNDMAMNNYACMLKNGEGAPVNRSEAIRYFKLAIEKGNTSAMFNYATMLERGDGIRLNKTEAKNEAIRYYKMAADRGHAAAMTKYATLSDFNHNDDFY